MITVVDLLGTPSLSQAATALGTTHQNARQLADALERKGFLQISADQADARIRRLRTTAKSTSYWHDRSAADQQQVLDWFGDLTPAEAQTLFELLAKVERKARAALSRPAPGPDTKPRPRSGHRPGALTGRPTPGRQRPPASKTPGSPDLRHVRDHATRVADRTGRLLPAGRPFALVQSVRDKTPSSDVPAVSHPRAHALCRLMIKAARPWRTA